MRSLYRSSIDTDYISSQHVLIRWEKTLAFLNKEKNVNTGLDIGDRTPFTDQLEKYFNCTFDNTNIDLDEEHLTGKYDIITAFEIIEHLFNPLHLLLEIKSILNEGGTLYVSTPKWKPYFLWSNEHFHEMGYDRLHSLIDRAGFCIIREKQIRIQPIWFYFTGIRPILRFIFERHLILKLSPR